jgi:hypothetical protein
LFTHLQCTEIKPLNAVQLSKLLFSKEVTQESEEEIVEEEQQVEEDDERRISFPVTDLEKQSQVQFLHLLTLCSYCKNGTKWV